jgi:putative flavoprotein involved in K+ transport
MDGFAWLMRIGFFDRTVDKLPSPKAKFAPAPHLTGARGGHTINLNQFARDGVALLGHIRDIRGEKVMLSPDLKENLAKADKFEADLIGAIDAFVERNGLNIAPERLPELRDGYDAEEILELDLSAAGIASIIWATGYAFDYSLVKLPIFDADSFPITKRGVTEYPGLYFLGLPWMDKWKSGFLAGIGESVEYIAEHIIARQQGTPPSQ